MSMTSCSKIKPEPSAAITLRLMGPLVKNSSVQITWLTKNLGGRKQRLFNSSFTAMSPKET
jgi:hypothetical protein